jgi:hypothetical protein
MMTQDILAKNDIESKRSMQNEDTSWIKPVNMLAFGGK